jgi:D-aspartate ligase
MNRQYQKNKIGAIVLGGHVQSLGIVRILGRHGIPIVVINKDRFNLARHSRYCSAFHRVDDEELLPFLNGLGASNIYSKWILFASNDFHVQLLSRNKLQLERYFIVSTDSWDVIKLFYNKRYTYQLTARLNIPMAATFFPDSEADLNAITVRYPCIIKPAVMFDFYKKMKTKVLVCEDEKELLCNYHKALEVIPANEIIVQEIIPGPSKNQFSACFLFLHGKSYVSLTACRMRQHPLEFGNATTYAETVDLPIIKEYGEQILSATHYQGVCEVEFKLDERDHQYKFLEVNPRTWKWHSIANKAETPFLKKFYDYLSDNEIKPVTKFKQASFSHPLTDFPVRIQLLFRGFSYWNHFLRPIEDAVWAVDDIKPWIFEKIYLLFLLFSR